MNIPAFVKQKCSISAQPALPGCDELAELWQQYQSDRHVQAVVRTIAGIDQQALDAVYRGTGSTPYCPTLMLWIVLFEILSGVGSPAQWHRDATSRDQCKLLGQGISPARSTWYDFQDRASKFVKQVHQKMIADGIRDGLVAPSERSLDGTFNAASASRFKMFNLKQLSRRLNRVIRKLDDPAQVDSTTASMRSLGKTNSTPLDRCTTSST